MVEMVHVLVMVPVISSLRECRVAVPVVAASRYFITRCQGHLHLTLMAVLVELLGLVIMQAVPVAQEAAVIIRWRSC
jgi:hypothetical protein